jgi:hypothetical protein
MATREVKPAGLEIPPGKSLISYEEAIQVLSREERFMATVYAMNTLLIEKGIYSTEELDFHIRQWAQKQLRKPQHQRIGNQSS